MPPYNHSSARQNQSAQVSSSSGPSSVPLAAAVPSTRRAASGSQRAANTSSSSAFSASNSDTHQAFRMEVQEVTPVSISLVWSLRPLPISHFNPLTASSSRPIENGSPRRAHNGKSSVKVRAATSAEEEEDWPSDDGATAVDEESERGDLSDTSSAAHWPERNGASQSSQSRAFNRAFEAGISILVNGKPWSQVVLGDQDAGEKVVVVYGLLPAQEYELDLTVGNSDESKTKMMARISTPSRPSSTDEHTQRSTAADAGPSSSQGHGQDGSEDDRLMDNENPSDSAGGLQATKLEEAEALRESLAAELRQGRKDASRAEQALRNEIEAIKRSIDRLSGSDHRSKQKVLALQESIRQANQSGKEILEEADATEGELGKWEDEEKEASMKEEEVRKQVEEAETEILQQLKSDETLTSAAEKEVNTARKALASKQVEVEKIRSGRIAELEKEIAELQAETERIKNAPTPPVPHQHPHAQWGRATMEPNAAPFHPSQFVGPRSVSGPAAGSGRGYRLDRGRGIKGNGPVRNVSSGFSRRGRGGMAGPANSGGYPFVATQGGQEVPWGVAGNANGPLPGAQAAPMQFNPAMPEFLPSSGNQQPSMQTVARSGGSMPQQHSSSPIYGNAAAYGQGPWAHADSSPHQQHSGPIASGGSRFGFGHTGAHSESTSVGHGSHLGHPAIGSTTPRDSPTATAAPFIPSAYGSAASTASDSGRRPSYGPLDNADVFDPTIPGPAPIFNSGSATNPGSARTFYSPQQWSRPGAVDPSNGGIPSPIASHLSNPSLWSTSSPPLGSGSPSSATGPTALRSPEDFWSPSTSNIQPSAHPTRLRNAVSALPYSQAPTSGSSASLYRQAQRDFSDPGVRQKAEQTDFRDTSSPSMWSQGQHL